MVVWLWFVSGSFIPSCDIVYASQNSYGILDSSGRVHSAVLQEICCVLSPLASAAAMPGHHVHQVLTHYPAVSALPTSVQSLGAPDLKNLAATMSSIGLAFVDRVSLCENDVEVLCETMYQVLGTRNHRQTNGVSVSMYQKPGWERRNTGISL